MEGEKRGREKREKGIPVNLYFFFWSLGARPSLTRKMERAWIM